MNHWASSYIGLKHAPGARGPREVDCWGLLVLVYRERFAIALPELPNVASVGLMRMATIIHRESEQEWLETKPFDGAAVGMSQRDAIHHVGIYTTADGGKIIHSMDGQSVMADTLRSIRLRGFRVIKFYRHKLWPT